MDANDEPDGVCFGGEAWNDVPAADRAWIQDAVRRALSTAGIPIRRLAVSVVRDPAMERLHARHLADPSTTDVLTFPASAPGDSVDADVAVCIDEASRRGAGTAHGARGELLLYVLHAVLHCRGHDDRDEASFRRMHDEKDRILREAGFGPIFGAGEAVP